MHELGIVFYIIDGVKAAAQDNSVFRVEAVTVELGEVSGVVPDLLQDAWNWAIKREPIMDEATLFTEVQPALNQCDDCKETFSPTKFGKTCPACGSPNTHLIQGSGAIIKNIAAR